MVCVQALQRGAHAFGIVGCKRCNLIIKCLQQIEIGFVSIKPTHLLTLFDFTDAAFQARVEDPSGLVLSKSAAALLHDDYLDRPQSKDDEANLIDFIVRKLRHVVHNIFVDEFNGFESEVGG